MNDLNSEIDAAYRTKTDRANRAIAGLCMGAGQAVQIGLTHTDKFAYVGAFSGTALRGDVQTAYGGVFGRAEEFNRKVKLLWIGAGTAEPARVSSGKADVAALKKAGIPAVWFEAPGTSHEWETWRRSLADFAPRLFR